MESDRASNPVLAVIPHLETAFELLQKASCEIGCPVHKRRLMRLAMGFQCLAGPIERLGLLLNGKFSEAAGNETENALSGITRVP